ncbi:MAG TPA: EpsI family protein [Planctomycetota bacterium]|nr:EpsI family protein [Planctomycetota bacterium]
MSRQAWILALVLGGTVLISHKYLYRDITERSAAKLVNFPQQIGVWRMAGEFAPTQREIELLETENIMTRIYRDEKGREVALVLVYDPSGNRKMAHPQEICLKADGQETVEKRSTQIPGTEIDAQRLLMERGGRRTLYYYWFKAGEYQSGSYISSQLRLAFSSLKSQPEGTALVRLSTRAQQDGRDADEVLQEFSLAIQPALMEQLP